MLSSHSLHKVFLTSQEKTVRDLSSHWSNFKVNFNLSYPEVLRMKNLQYLKGVQKHWSHSNVEGLDLRQLVVSATLEL